MTRRPQSTCALYTSAHYNRDNTVCAKIYECIDYLFADDAKLYRNILSDEDTLSSLVYVPYKNVQMLLKLNDSKCKSVYYGRNINHNFTKLENVNVIKDLGIYFDPDLSFFYTLEGEDKQSLCNAGDHKEKFYVLIRGSLCL